MSIEEIVLTGGASRRMGQDKATLLVEGEPLAHRIARLLVTRCERVTILGRNPIDGFLFVADGEEYAGPLSALGRFSPVSDHVFVASCDLARFDAEVVDEVHARLGEADCVVPVLEGRDQPLCALYRSHCFELADSLSEQGERRLMAWIDRLRASRVAAADLPHGYACLNVNTPTELQRALWPPT